MQLIACTGCERHVKVGEGPCPFCGAEVPEVAPRYAPRRPVGRAGRAAMIFFGVAVAGPAGGCIAAYGAPEPPPPDAATAQDAGVDAGIVAPAYGAPIDAGE